MQQEDEISLVDFLVVVIKHRRFIIGATALSAVFASVVLFLLPLIGVVSSGTYTVTALTIPSQIPPALEKELGLIPSVLATSYAKDVKEVAEAALRNGLARTVVGDSEGWRFRTYIAKSFMGRKYKVQGKDGVISFEVSVKDPEAGKTFLSQMIAYVDRRMRSEIADRSAVIAESMESLRNTDTASTGLTDSARQLIISSEIYRSGRTPALIVSSEPEILVDSQGRAKNAVVIVLAAFFLSIFLAFVLEYIDRVKADPESSEKLRKALGR